MANAPRKLAWRIGEVVETSPDTPRTKSLFLEVPGWEGHRAGQHVDVRLTAEDGYQAQRSYSIASAPMDERLALTVERLVGGGSGVVPLMAMLRHREAAGSEEDAALLYSARSLDDVIYREELSRLSAADGSPRVAYTLTRERPE